MDSLIKNKSFILGCRIFFGAVFVYASIDKIFNPEAFAGILYNYKLLPDFIIYPAALFLPWIEIIAGSFLMAGIFARGSSFILNALLIVFLLAITINLARGVNFDCGCFSTAKGDGSNIYFLLTRDILLLFPGLLVFYYYNKRRTDDNEH